MNAAEQGALAPHVLPAPWANGRRSGLIAVRMDRLDGRRLH
jgi:hypothetical protein